MLEHRILPQQRGIELDDGVEPALLEADICAIRSISSGGHPCIVDSVTLLTMAAGISTSANRGNSRRSVARIAASGSDASAITSMKRVMRGWRMPARS